MFGLSPAASQYPLWLVVLIFGGSVALVTFAGVRVTKKGAELADRTGLGQAIIGAVFIGAATSLPGSIASVLAAWLDHPSLAVSNCLGGIAAQTAFLAIADLAYRKANLEHAAAAPENLTQGALLLVLLGVVLLAVNGPNVTILGVNPLSLGLVAAYLFGLRLISQTQKFPMWFPRTTEETREEKDDHYARSEGSLARVWGSFGLWVVVLVVSGFIGAEAAVALVEKTGVSETLFGVLVLSVATSMPELVIALGAVRRGALTLAVGNIIGGNSFDVLFTSFADVAYRSGSIYHAIVSEDRFVISLTLAMTGVLMLGLLRRQPHGPANIGFESITILLLYAAGLAFIGLS